MSEASAHARKADLTGSRIGRFVVLAQLGEGGMGEVFRARDTKLNRTVALKRLRVADGNGAQKSRILAEAEKACRVNHPNVATVYDVIEEGADLLLVMEYVEGHTLRHRLRTTPPSVDEALQIAAQCTDALAAAHKQGVIHCDIKPENVMLTADGGLKLLDFGVARTFTSPDNATLASRTQTNVFSGTPAYMAPEVLNEHAPDCRADIFSLGVVLYEMLGGENPFQTATIIETANRVIHRDPPPLRKMHPEVPEQVDRIVAHAIEKSRDQRYETATALGRDLRAILGGQPQLVAAPVHTRKRRYWDKTAPIIVVIALLVIAVGLWQEFRPTPAAPESRLVAVLPFTVSTQDHSAQAFSDGLVETVSAKLSRISDGQKLQVIPAWEVRSQGVTTAEQAEKALGVNLVVEGSLRYADGSVRVTYALVDAHTRRQLRGDSITAVMSNPFDVEDRVVDSVLSSLQVVLQPQQREALNAGRPTEPTAYDFYLQGRGYLQDYHKSENVESAITVFQNALKVDPKFALAHAGLGEAYWYKWLLTHKPEFVRSAQDACRQAVKLSPATAEGHICLGIVDNGTGKYEDAVNELQTAGNSDPTNATAFAALGNGFERLNRLPEAEQAFRKAIAARPSYWMGYSQLGAFYFRHARYKDALDAFKKTTELAPDNFLVYNNIAGVYLATGDYKNAAANAERSIALRPTGEAYSNAAAAYFFEHRYADSAAKLEQAVALQSNDNVLWLNLAESWRWAGDKSKTATAAQKAVSLAEQAIKINPRDANSFAYLAYAYALLNDCPNSRKSAEKALAITPADADVLLFGALAYSECGDSKRAATYAEKSLRAGIMPSQIKDHPALAGLKLGL
jgi:tetratricopeptide (TPR) repeat protein/TolB-like protein/tRNA A-37 threonylcarbamoyl transferase component Bud32